MLEQGVYSSSYSVFGPPALMPPLSSTLLHVLQITKKCRTVCVSRPTNSVSSPSVWLFISSRRTTVTPPSSHTKVNDPEAGCRNKHREKIEKVVHDSWKHSVRFHCRIYWHWVNSKEAPAYLIYTTSYNILFMMV